MTSGDLLVLHLAIIEYSAKQFYITKFEQKIKVSSQETLCREKSRRMKSYDGKASGNPNQYCV